MNNQPTRFEATLNLAVAAMTILVCGSLTADQGVELSSYRTVHLSLREEFDDVYRVFRNMNVRMFKLAIPDLEPDLFEGWKRNVGSERVRVLIRLRQRPCIIADALKKEFGQTWVPGRIMRGAESLRARNLSSQLGIDRCDLHFIGHNMADLDLDAVWEQLRERLTELRAEIAKGGAK